MGKFYICLIISIPQLVLYYYAFRNSNVVSKVISVFMEKKDKCSLKYGCSVEQWKENTGLIIK